MLTITHGFNNIGSDIAKTAINFSRNRVLCLRKAALVTGSSIIMGTPVDTGMARGNWQSSIDSPILSEIDRLDASGSQAISDIGTISARFKNDNHSIWLTNNLPYINRLNTGWSKKADAGYVERAIEGVALQFGDDFLLKDN